MMECEEHYEISHTKECSICKAIFPTDHLLDLHLQECHDSYFLSAIESQRARFQCLVSTCTQTFENDAERLTHLRQQHNYPNWFRFHSRSKNHPSLTSQKKTLKKHAIPKDNHNINSFGDTKKNSLTKDQLRKKAARKKRQKENRASTPCTFFLSSYCRRGDTCMFLHDSSTKTKSTQQEDQLEMITTQMNKAHVSVPDKLSFGRRKSRSILSMRQH